MEKEIVAKKRNTRWFVTVCILIVSLQYAMCIHYGLKRQYLFCDEVYSYGLANSNDKAFIHPGEDDEPFLHWVTGDYFTDYMNYGDEHFNFKAAYTNQEKDVHPPLYYMLLHIVCRFFPDAGYSAVPGLVVNFILLIFVDVLLLYVASYLLKNKWYGLMAAGLWSLSSAGISNCMLIRMYLLQTLNVLLVAAAHVYILKHKRKMTVPYFIMLAITVLFGGLTHYYFYFFVAGLGLCACIYLMYMKQIKQMLAYGFSLITGLLVALMVFPATLSHVFGYRGSYATHNITGISEKKFIYYIKYVNRACFAGILPVLILAATVLVFIYILTRFVDISIKTQRSGMKLSYNVSVKRRDISKEFSGILEGRRILFASVCVADFILAFVSIQGSELVNARYIYSSLAVFIIVLVWCLKKLVSVVTKKHIMTVTSILCIFLCVGSLMANGVDWQYEDYKYKKTAIEEMRGQDCIIVCHGNNKWNNIYAGVNVFSQMGRCRYVYDEQLRDVLEYIKDCSDEVYVAFINDPKYEKGAIQNMLKRIIKASKYEHFELQYSYSPIFVYSLTVDTRCADNNFEQERVGHEKGKPCNTMFQ